MNKYAKMFAIVLGAVLSAVSAALVGDNSISPQEWINISIIAVGALGVFAAPNVPGAEYTKTILAVLTTVLTALASVALHGIGLSDIIQIVIAAVSALGVYQAPSSKAPVGS